MWSSVDDRGNRAVQSPTKGAECRPSRQRLTDEAFPATQKSGHTRGTADSTTMPKSATTNQRNHALEETASSRAERGGVRRWGWGLPDHAKHASERAETNTWVSTWTSEGILETGNTLRSRCEFGARGARLTHSPKATPGANTAQVEASSLGEHGQIG